MIRKQVVSVVGLLFAVISTNSVSDVTVESDKYAGDLTSYLSAWKSCRNTAKGLKRGEYESKSEFAKRKQQASANCSGFSDVQVETKWVLHYNADRQRFVISLSDRFPDIRINGLVEAYGGNDTPRYGDGPTGCWNRWSTNSYYTCKISRTATCEKPTFKLDDVVRRIDINSKCFHVYKRQFNTTWNSGSYYSISYDKIALYIPLKEARRLKSNEDSLYIETKGRLSRSGKLHVSSFKITNRANGKVIAAWEK